MERIAGTKLSRKITLSESLDEFRHQVFVQDGRLMRFVIMDVFKPAA